MTVKNATNLSDPEVPCPYCGQFCDDNCDAFADDDVADAPETRPLTDYEMDTPLGQMYADGFESDF